VDEHGWSTAQYAKKEEYIVTFSSKNGDKHSSTQVKKYQKYFQLEMTKNIKQVDSVMQSKK
jgi:hypothetical protein